ncbi:MAG: N-acetyltransferase family protein [Bacillota bacterium]
MDFKIRKSNKQDYEDLCELYRQSDLMHHQALSEMFEKPLSPPRDKEYLFTFMEDKDSSIFVAEYKEKVIGLIAFKLLHSKDIPILKKRTYLKINEIVVDEQYRGNGIGKTLMKEAHNWAIDKGINEIELNVFKFNQNAIEFYRDLGYEVRNLTMTKKLN